MNDSAIHRSAPPDSQGPTPTRSSWLAWSTLLLVAAIAIALVYLSVALRAHADDRRQVMEQLTALKAEATGQHTMVWRAMTQLMAGDQMTFIRTRGQVNSQSKEIVAQLMQLRESESAGEVWNRRLGFAAAPELLESVTQNTERFLGSVRGTLGQMNIGRDRMRDRLAYWDMNYGAFEESLAALRARAEQTAVVSARTADRVTAAAALITLAASLLFVASLAKVRTRRARELDAERLRTLAASESRFRALVQNSADLIMVLEPDGRLRYATPSAAALIHRGAEAPAAAGHEPPVIDALIGTSTQALLGQERLEVEIGSTDAERRVYELRASDLREHPDIGGIVVNGRDVSQAKALEAQLRHQAMHDPLTGLPNRRSFGDRYEKMSIEQRRECRVLFIDLDGFKLVNDSYGHSVGDQLLIHTAARIKTCLAEGDLLARQGGDEFLVLCESAATPERIFASLAAPFDIGRWIGEAAQAQDHGTEIFVSASVGVVDQLAGLDAEQAVQRADIAMYAAKAAGKSKVVAFADEMLQGAPEKLALEADFRRALERDEFTVVYQPKVGLNSGITESLEALVRWIHPTRGFVGPDLFIPFAEESGLIDELGRRILRKACMDAVRWQPFGVVVAVNLSPIQFCNPRLVEEVRAALDDSGLEPRFLELEITESAVLGDVANTIRVMHELKALGVRLAIDDFGTGYSNLAHLKHFAVDVLKIDQAFVRGGVSGSRESLSDRPIVEAVIGMARAFGLHVVAEGVESANHAAELKSLGADLGQGYYFSKPVDGQGIDDFLRAEVTTGRRSGASAPAGIVPAD